MKRIAPLIILLLLVATSASAGMILAGVLSSYRVPQAPNAPTGVSATTADLQSTITFTGSAVDSTHDAATQYNLLRSTTSGAETLLTSNITSPYTNTGLAAGTTYYYKVQAQNATDTANSAEVNITTAATGTLGFETASLTPAGLSTAYTINNATYAARSTTQKHGGGSYAMAIQPSAGATPKGELVRQVTFPSSGTVTFERWFAFGSVTPPASSPSQCAIFNISTGSDPTTGPTGWTIGVYLQLVSGQDSLYGLVYYNPGYAGVSLYPQSNFISAGANTWYRVKVDLNCSNNTYAVTLYNAAGAQLAAASALTPNVGTFSGTTQYVYMGRMDNNGTAVYVDDITDGI